jgi:hypothetical protein
VGPQRESGLATVPTGCYGRPTFAIRGGSPISSTIFIGNLSYEATEDDLRAVLVEIDPRVRVRMGIDRLTGKARGFAFAEFSDANLAADAIRRCDGQELRGRRMRVNDADDKPPPRAPRPGGPGAGPGFGAGGPPFGGAPRPFGPRPGGGAPGAPRFGGAPGGGGGYAPSFPPPEPPPDPDLAGGWGGGKKGGGSRRNLRAKKRSLRWG